MHQRAGHRSSFQKRLVHSGGNEMRRLPTTRVNRGSETCWGIPKRDGKAPTVISLHSSLGGMALGTMTTAADKSPRESKAARRFDARLGDTTRWSTAKSTKGVTVPP
jgi:hypothetical protein